MGNEKRVRAGVRVAVGAVAAIVVGGGAIGCGSEASPPVAGGTTTAADILDDASMAALRATAEATSFVVEIDGEGLPVQSLRYTAPFTYESMPGASPMLVVDGVQYERPPPPPPGPVTDPDVMVAMPTGVDAGGPMPVPFFIDLLDPSGGYGGPGYRIVSVETDGTHATVVRAETSRGPIELRFSEFDVPTTPPTTPTNTAPSGGP